MHGYCGGHHLSVLGLLGLAAGLGFGPPSGFTVRITARAIIRGTTRGCAEQAIIRAIILPCCAGDLLGYRPRCLPLGRLMLRVQGSLLLQCTGLGAGQGRGGLYTELEESMTAPSHDCALPAHYPKHSHTHRGVSH